MQESGKEITLQLTNLHGDVSATAAISSEATSLKATFGYDEFGNPTSGTAGRYGWLGGKQRRSEFPSGVIQMGARSYVPQIGRFLSVDPVLGGSASAYDYANQDPINKLDINGAKCELTSPSLNGGRTQVSRAGHFTLKAKAWAHCTSKAARKVHVKAVIAGGSYTPAPGVTKRIPGQTGPSIDCGDAHPKFTCEAPAQVTVEANPACGETWPGELFVVFSVTWMQGGVKHEEAIGAELNFVLVGICKENEKTTCTQAIATLPRRCSGYRANVLGRSYSSDD